MRSPLEQQPAVVGGLRPSQLMEVGAQPEGVGTSEGKVAPKTGHLATVQTLEGRGPWCLSTEIDQSVGLAETGKCRAFVRFGPRYARPASRLQAEVQVKSPTTNPPGVVA